MYILEFKPIGGCSATMQRHDCISLRDVFDKIFYSKNIGDLIIDKFLCDIMIEKVHTNVDLNKVKVVMGDYSKGMLGNLVNVVKRNNTIVHVYKEQAGMLDI